MTKHQRILVDCFERLPKRNLENLAFHVKRGTAICCKETADLWTDGEGGG